MLRGFLLALVVVFGILAINFRSFKWAIVGYVPLLLTVLFIYGAVGLMRKDFDMPISVLSCLSLGMAVDFSIQCTPSECGRPRREKPRGHPVRREALRVMRKPSKKLQRHREFRKPLMANMLTRSSTRRTIWKERQETGFIRKPSKH